MRPALLLVLSVGVLALCAAGSAGTTPPPPVSALTVTYRAAGATSAPTKWTLHCNPARGSLPHPATACRRLASGGPKLFAPVPKGVMCTDIYGGPQVAVVVGVVSGIRIWTRFSRENGCQIARWNRVSPWLLPPGGVP